MKSSDIISIAKEVIQIEADAVSLIRNRIDNNFKEAVNTILKCTGRLIVTGMGKSGLISQKIASTLASTGTPSHFVHPADAIHGDLGMITDNDILLIISNSGETKELIEILPAINKKKIIIIGLIGRKKSTLAYNSDIHLDTSVKKEACTLDLVPTASTTATLAMGDALAITLLELRGFNKTDYAELHPGGSLGKRLLLTVDVIYHSGKDIPLLYNTNSIKEALFIISEKGLGITGVLNDDDQLVGIITDGDIRRGLEKYGDNLFNKTVEFVMSHEPKWVTADTLAISALELMKKYAITSLFVFSVDNKKHPEGIVHIHDILKLGVD